MNQNRKIPFGYTVRNGRTVIDPKEAECIRGIFEQYIGGASLKDIAERLTAEQVPFTIKSCTWGKARVARIIENAKYIGSGEYDPIIQEDTYELALECKRARQKPTLAGYSQEIDLIRSHVKCEKCGHPMVRRVNNKCRIRESWNCQNPECKTAVRIGDFDLVEKIRILINRIIENSNLIIPTPKPKKDSTAALKLKESINKELESSHPSEELILDLISKTVSQEYRDYNSRDAITARIAKQRVDHMTPQSEFNAAYFSDLVKTVYIGDAGRVRIITNTDAEIYESEGQE